MSRANDGALEAMLAHHRVLADGVERRARAIEVADAGYQTATADLVAYAAREILPHALAEEHTIYRLAATRADLGDIVRRLVDEHAGLALGIERLAKTTDLAEARSCAAHISLLFKAHVQDENEVVLPVIAADPGVDLAEILVRMHRLTEAAQRETSIREDSSTIDSETLLVRYLLDAASKLAEVGEGDHGCRLVAHAWAALRVPRPDLAVRLTAELHRLVRFVTAQPVTFSSGPSQGSASALLAGTLDVRSLPPAQRHEKIFATYAALGPGASFLLVNDHDPKPLRYQFEAEHAEQFTWGVLQAGPDVWSVRIGRPGEPQGAGFTDDPELDVRSFPHGQRHDVIFVAYDSLLEGSGFVLVNDHDPRPLRYQFEAEHHGRYTWDYLEEGPQVWRVRIGRMAETSS
ncbi:MAG: DUF2249 domain-containing protein [Acidimicrobiales bacterium]